MGKELELPTEMRLLSEPQVQRDSFNLLTGKQKLLRDKDSLVVQPILRSTPILFFEHSL